MARTPTGVWTPLSAAQVNLLAPQRDLRVASKRNFFASSVESHKSLPYRVGVDTGVATLAGFSLSWFITPMDQAVMERMSGKATMSSSLKESAKSIFSSPAAYARSPQYFYVFGTYLGTYLSKNYVDTWSKTQHVSKETAAFATFWGVFAVNGGLSVFWKDPGLAKLFGKTAATMPPSAYGAWMARDVFHMLGAVVAPDYCEEKFKWTKDQWRMAQTTFPLAVQLITTPCHLLGLDFYNERRSTLSARLGRVGKSWLPSAGIRMVRMFAPWSLGLLINRDLRDYLLKD